MEKKRNANREILAALLAGRKLSQMNCKEFQVEDMRTPISHLRKRYQDTHDLKFQWITTPTNGSRIKLYWLEER